MDNEKSRPPFRWFETWHLKNPAEEISLNTKMTCQLPSQLASLHLLNMLAFPKVSPGTCSIPVYHTTRCSSKLKDGPHKMDFYPLKMHIGIFSGCADVSAVLLHAWCNTADRLGVTQTKRFPLKMLGILVEKKGIMQPHTDTYCMYTHTLH